MNAAAIPDGPHQRPPEIIPVAHIEASIQPGLPTFSETAAFKDQQQEKLRIEKLKQDRQIRFPGNNPLSNFLNSFLDDPEDPTYL